mmetsp:Transcript_56946/g.133760  ORF Transcript_56946/g.133760 Transcript_56946/m.133760 type:complete len:102 (+) Transcript_56946:64-369(+)
MAKAMFLVAVFCALSLSVGSPLRGVPEEQTEASSRRLEELPSCDHDKECCGFAAYQKIDGKCVEVDPNTTESALLSMLVFVAAPCLGIPLAMYMKMGSVKI